MSDLEKDRIESMVRNMNEEEVRFLCTLIDDIPLVNEAGMRLVKFRKYAGEAKESLEKVV